MLQWILSWCRMKAHWCYALKNVNMQRWSWHLQKREGSPIYLTSSTAFSLSSYTPTTLMIPQKYLSMHAHTTLALYLFSTQHQHVSMPPVIWVVSMVCVWNIFSLPPFGELRPHATIAFSCWQAAVSQQKWVWAPIMWCVCLLSFHSITGAHYTPCMLIHWFDKIGNSPDEDMVMWMVWLSCCANNSPNYAVIHTDSIYWAAHLIPIYGTRFTSHDTQPHHSYDTFWAFYVNKYVDHHAFKIIQ